MKDFSPEILQTLSGTQGGRIFTIFKFMVDSGIIKEAYASLSDDQLIAIAKKDGAVITYEAFVILKREYSKRKLDPAIISEIEQIRLEQSKEKVLSNFKREENIISNKFWSEVYKQKASGKKNDEIINWLKKEGVDPEAASEAIANLGKYAKADYNRAKKAMIISFVAILTGILVCGAFFYGEVNSTFGLLGAILTITIIKLFPANNRIYRLCEKVLSVIEEEKAEKTEA